MPSSDGRMATWAHETPDITRNVTHLTAGKQPEREGAGAKGPVAGKVGFPLGVRLCRAGSTEVVRAQNKCPEGQGLGRPSHALGEMWP